MKTFPRDKLPPGDIDRQVHKRAAALSLDKLHRYTLDRLFVDKPLAQLRWVLFIMLNPSTADTVKDDNTVRRVMRFAYDWGYDGVRVCNLFSYRATDPKQLWSNMANPLVAMGDRGNIPAIIRSVHASPAEIICAWGAFDQAKARANEVLGRIAFELGAQACADKIKALGFSQDGHPRHPLRLLKTTERVPFAGYAGAA